MDASDWIALGAAVIAAVSLGVSGWATLYARSSAESNKVMAAANKAMAEEAKESRVLAAGQRRADMDQVHRDLAPPQPAVFAASLHEGTPTDALAASIAVPRGYRIQADVLFGSGGSAPAGLGSVLHANREETFFFELWPPGSTRPKTEAIRVRFWPPLPGDGVDVWSCDCGRPTGESLDGDGHWEWHVRVEYEQRNPRYRSFDPRGDD